MKSGFFDISLVYGTIWKRDLLLKLAKIFKNKTILRLVEKTLSDRNFKVNLNGKINWRKILLNGLPQRSVLSLTLFNVYDISYREYKIKIIHVHGWHRISNPRKLIWATRKHVEQESIHLTKLFYKLISHTKF